LVASHIKPRNECTEKERIDPSVVMLACVLGCDSLFDKGFIYVAQNGIIKVSRKSDFYPDLSQFISAIDGKVAQASSQNRKHYFAWHERNIALKTQKRLFHKLLNSIVHEVSDHLTNIEDIGINT
jgi:hypothetical protein